LTTPTPLREKLLLLGVPVGPRFRDNFTRARRGCATQTPLGVSIAGCDSASAIEGSFRSRIPLRKNVPVSGVAPPWFLDALARTSFRRAFPTAPPARGGNPAASVSVMARKPGKRRDDTGAIILAADRTLFSAAAMAERQTPASMRLAETAQQMLCRANALGMYCAIAPAIRRSAAGEGSFDPPTPLRRNSLLLRIAASAVST
jgi:hypothetical protein